MAGRVATKHDEGPMPSVDHINKEVLFKIVYYGPGLGGKTTNLERIYEQAAPEQCGTMLALCSDSERTLFFDLLPIGLGSYRGYSVRLHLCTVPGQVFQDKIRKLVLTGVDGVVFVADSQPAMLDSNWQSFDNLRDNLTEHGLSYETVPLVIQYNKRDLDSALPISALRELLRVPPGAPEVEAAAREGIGVAETLKTIIRECMSTLRDPAECPAGRSPAILPKRHASGFHRKVTETPSNANSA